MLVVPDNSDDFVLLVVCTELELYVKVDVARTVVVDMVVVA